MNIHNTQFIGKVLLYFSSLASTNEYAMQLLEDEKIEEGTIIATAHQFSGKGQMGNVWESAPTANIAMSIIIKPSFLKARQQFFLNIITALAVREALASFISQPVQIKWANDILIASKKTCGILIQNILVGEQIQASVVGIGINVNQLHFGEHLPRATSMALATGNQFEVASVMNEVCQQFERYYLLLRQGNFKSLEATYYQYLYQYQVWSWYENLEGQEIKGKIIGISEHGRLIVTHEDGIKTYDLKEIKQLFKTL